MRQPPYYDSWPEYLWETLLETTAGLCLVVMVCAAWFAAGMLVGVALMAAAHAGEVADCAHDRYLEAMDSPKTNTVAGILKASDFAVTFCLGQHSSAADNAEFDAGVDRAFGELMQALKGQKL
jgi:hypothetical protein